MIIFREHAYVSKILIAVNSIVIPEPHGIHKIQTIHHDIYKGMRIFRRKDLVQLPKKHLELICSNGIFRIVLETQSHAIATVFEIVRIETERIHKPLESRIYFLVHDHLDFIDQILKKFFKRFL